MVAQVNDVWTADFTPPAAGRYTEARLSRIAATLPEDLDKETVAFSVRLATG